MSRRYENWLARLESVVRRDHRAAAVISAFSADAPRVPPEWCERMEYSMRGPRPTDTIDGADVCMWMLMDAMKWSVPPPISEPPKNWTYDWLLLAARIVGMAMEDDAYEESLFSALSEMNFAEQRDTIAWLLDEFPRKLKVELAGIAPPPDGGTIVYRAVTRFVELHPRLQLAN